MRIISKSEDNAVIEFTREEIGVLGIVGLEFTSGPYAPDDEGFHEATHRTRAQVAAVFDALPDFD